MGSNNRTFEVEFTEEYIEEIEEIYNYISKELKENNIAKRLINKINNKILDLSYLPEIYMKIGRKDMLKREYHRMTVKNYNILYTIDYEKRKVYISSILYKIKNYLN